MKCRRGRRFGIIFRRNIRSDIKKEPVGRKVPYISLVFYCNFRQD